MLNGLKIFSGVLLITIFLTGCGHEKLVEKKTNNTFDFGNRPTISQLNDGTFVYKDKKYAGTDDMQFGF